MRLFGRERESIRVKKIRGSRAVIALHEEQVECNLRLVTEDGEVLDIIVPDKELPVLIQDLVITYQAIHPPIRFGNWNSQQDGMQNS